VTNTMSYNSHSHDSKISAEQSSTAQGGNIKIDLIQSSTF